MVSLHSTTKSPFRDSTLRMAYQLLLLVAVYLLYHVSNNDLYFWKSALMRLHHYAYWTPTCRVEVIADISKHITSWYHQSQLSHFCSGSLFPQQSLVSMKLDHMILYNRISKSQKQRHLAGHQGYSYGCDGKFGKGVQAMYFGDHSESCFLNTV